ncbi:DUF3885 domain-containing protein [Pseudomonas sp. NPDC087598]|uniref:DUF3885 domain-containing protein n=1 Tax=Pseudomonas sp. NPDC087598 TaxID=3364440 RepID=UPI00381383D4
MWFPRGAGVDCGAADTGLRQKGGQSGPVAYLYHRHNAWLLDYDRAVMDSTFANAAVVAGIKRHDR